MSTHDYAAIEHIIRRERLERTIVIAEGLAGFLVDAAGYFGRKATQAGERIEQISPYLPRSQA